MTDETPGGTNVTTPFPITLPEATKVFMFLPHMQAAVVTAALEQQQETLQFCERRCKAGLALAHELGDAANASDLFTAYAGFARQAFTDYSVEAKSALERSTQSALETVRAAQKEAAGFGATALQAA
ncbi:hypothetical protein [uncultured Sphingomonas sp.]|uniref:hypothetical protein n=1 Tax=uncultured Sphingomonas sp. TaxID=158754 RepID=UPI0025EEA794|nr:hypothetical protein [uncultured Sphingomonas sp.]